jgi:hypothetical protein
MIAGMIVLYQAQPMIVTKLRDIPTLSWARNSVEYTLAPMNRGPGPVEYVFVTDPTADVLPLLPACTDCGVGAEPGGFGSPGWGCSMDCSVTTMRRVPS